jgi:hypothetical protein
MATDKMREASASATGYLFQCRYALLAALRAILDAPELEISIEKLDDVAFGPPPEMMSAKQEAAEISD